MTYIYLINYYHILSRSIRTGDFGLFKYVLPKITNLFFAFNQPNYARWLVKYHNNLLVVDETHPDIAEGLEKGCLGIQRTDKSFSRQPIDLTLEQTINAEAAKARQRWCKSHEIRSTIISFTYEATGLQKRQDVTSDLEKHNIKRDTKLLRNFIATFSKFMNPFDSSLDKNLLFNISNGKSASQNVEQFLLNMESTGNELRDKFISECSESVDRFEKPITRVKILNFTSETVKKNLNGGNTVQEVRMQRDLFGRMLGISMDYKIDFEKILCYPIIPIPSSLCHIDGTICKTVKSAIVDVFEKNHKPGNTPKNYDIVIVDGFYLLHTMRDMPATIGNISKKIMRSLTATKAPRIDIIFDQYFSPSIKDYERTLRNEVNAMDFKITGPMQVRPVDFNKELKNIKFKQALVNFLISNWASQEMAPFIGNTIINLSYDKCYSYKVQNNVVKMEENYELSCDDHEEADTKIVRHVCKIDNDFATNVLIKSCDTDVLIITLGNMDHLQCNSLTIFMEYGNNNKRRLINISQLSTELGPKVCSSLPGFHALTGCDYNPSFFKKGKKRPFHILKANEDYQKAFTNLGSAHVTGSRYEDFVLLEKFVCEMYGFKNVTDVNIARFQKFCSTYKANNSNEPFKKLLKNYDASNLPPCKVELHQQLLRTQYITSIWRNAHLRYPTTLTPSRNGWDLQDGKLELYWFEGDCVPPSVLDALKSYKEKTKNTTNSESSEENEAPQDIDDLSDCDNGLSESEDDLSDSASAESSEEEV
ncbi:hypothetical protein RI129_000142 [Pyrocoelia pectoralis]|uniref:Uncharacterized protein n=1 Tax=Pyrocoelia pectoralis TaxID=417401 RepID=A0AAN7V5K8_9COLE